MNKSNSIDGEALMNARITSHPIGDPGDRRSFNIFVNNRPVRVFEGDEFVDNLTIDDFEVLEDGILQRTEAVYLIKKRTVERREEKKNVRWSEDRRSEEKLKASRQRLAQQPLYQ